MPGSTRRKPTLVLFTLAALLAPSLRAQADAAPTEISPELELAASGASPAAAIAPNGNALLAWLDHGVRARQLKANGTLGALRSVRDTGRPASELRAGSSANGFVLVWQELGANDESHVLAQRLRADGTPRAASVKEIALPNIESTLDLGVSADGRFAVLFTDTRPLGDDAVSATARLLRFAADGRRLGSPLRLAGGSRPLDERELRSGGVAAGADFIAAGWTSLTGCDGPGSPDVQAAVARATWNGSSSQTVATFADGHACDGGPLLQGLLPSDVGTLAVLSGHTQNFQRFDPATGDPSGARTVFADQPQPACEDSVCTRLVGVAGDANGRFASVWETADDDGYVVSVQLRGREGQERSEVIQLNETPSARATHPAVVLASNGVAHVVWEQAVDEDMESPAAIHLRSVRFR
jgi:hypothetical protein